MLLGCGPDSITPVAPVIRCAGCLEYDAVSPGTAFDVYVAWTARCTNDGPLPDTSQTYACDEQPFIARVACSGAACSVSPPSASAGGARFSGEGELGVVLTDEGDVEVTVELEHAETGEISSQTFSYKVRRPERIALDCWWNSDPLAKTCVDQGTYKLCETTTWRPCEANLALEPEGGNPLSIWVYGEAQGMPVRLMPVAQVSFAGFTPDGVAQNDGAPHDNPDALLEADRFSARLTQPGKYAISASFAALSTSLTIDAR